MDKELFLDEEFDESNDMNGEKSLDEALDEMDKWGDQVSESLQGLSHKEIVAHFRRLQDSFEIQQSMPPNLAVVGGS